MGEAKRKARLATVRTWARGAIKIVANNVECFDWSGTREDAADLCNSFLATLAANHVQISADSYARRAAGYLMAFGVPKEGEPDLRPSNFGQHWTCTEITMQRWAILWMAMQERIPTTGERIEDFFVGKSMFVPLDVNREQILEETAREQEGKPFTGGEFQMKVGVADYNYALDPSKAICMSEADLFSLAKGEPYPAGLRDDGVYVPRLPRDAAEANAMFGTYTITLDATVPWDGIGEPPMRNYAGYTEAELLRPTCRTRAMCRIGLIAAVRLRSCSNWRVQHRFTIRSSRSLIFTMCANF